MSFGPLKLHTWILKFILLLCLEIYDLHQKVVEQTTNYGFPAPLNENTGQNLDNETPVLRKLSYFLSLSAAGNPYFVVHQTIS
jgi:hypothetical protein